MPQSYYMLFSLLQKDLTINALCKATLIMKYFAHFADVSCGYVWPTSSRALPIVQRQVVVITGFLTASCQEIEVSQTLALSK